MKKIITSALVIALTIGAAQAQTTQAPEGKKHDKKEHRGEGFKQLNLTAEQKAKLKTIHEEQKKEMQALKGEKDANKEQRKAIHEKYQAQMESVLTADQKQQLAKMKEERKAAWKNGDFKKGGKFRQNGDSTRMGHKGKFGKGADMSKELGLSATQQEQMKKIRADYSSQFQALRNDNNLTKDQKKDKMQELRKAQMEKMKTVLTPEQMDKMKSFRKEHSSRNTK
jgi:Spy/CpxP family protein refolding chaperone